MAGEAVIFGAGAIGGSIGAYAARAGLPVLLVDRYREHVDRINRDGLRIHGDRGEFVAPVPACLPEGMPARLSTVFLAVKGQDTAGALDWIEPRLAADGVVVSLQNGLSCSAIARRLGADRVVASFVNFPADLTGPGEIREAADGNVYLGELDGRLTPRLEAIAEVIRPAREVVITGNILGYLWAKQGYASLAFATALVDATVGDVLDEERNKRVIIALCQETLAVARALGIRLEPFRDFDPGLYAPANRANLEQTFAAMQDYGDRSRRSAKPHTGIWNDLVVRKRKTEVDAILGEVVAAGREAGVDVRLNERLVAMIHEIEDGTRPMGFHNLGELETQARAEGKWLPF